MTSVMWVGKHIEIEPCKNPLKITGTRLGSILGMNKWNTPFKTWCEITRTYKEPFVDTIYTIAGKVIEPKQAEYMKHSYGMVNLVTPAEQYGNDYFRTTHGDFFADTPVFGGMDDYLLVDENDYPTTVLEMKTTKRIEDWVEDIPEYYALQAAMYAWLRGVDDVIMVASCLGEGDYEHPEAFVPSIKNTIVRPFKVSERYPDFKMIIDRATEWWNDHVVKGISPDFDEKKDADILKELRTSHPDIESEMANLLTEAEGLIAEIEAANAAIASSVKRLDAIKKAYKEAMVKKWRDGDTKVSTTAGKHQWVVSRKVSETVDKDAMKRDGVYEKYTTESVSYTLTTPEVKEKK